MLKRIAGAATLTAGVVGVGRSRATATAERASRGVAGTIRSANSQLNFSSSPGGWSVRNVGFRGHRNATSPVIAAAATDPGGSAVIDGCYFGDGGSGTGIWVSPDHAGTLVIRNCLFEGWGNNAVYGSPPGNPPEHPHPGRGGVVRVENCYAKNNTTSNFRLGTTGSYVRNSVSFGSHRGFWGYYETTRVVDCDIGCGIYAGASAWNSAAEVDLSGTRFAGGETRSENGATIRGSSEGQPSDHYPGVPVSASDAQTGTLTR